MREALKKIGKKYKWKFLIQIVFIIINIYLLTLPATIIGQIIDYMYDISANQTQIMMCVYWLMGISLLLLVIRVIWKFFDTYLPRSVEMELKNVLFSQLLKLKIHEIQNKKNGELMSYFVKDISEIRACTGRIFSYGTRIVAYTVFVIYAMIVNVDFKLTLVTMLPIVITAFIIVKIKGYLENSFKKAQATFTELSEYIQESTDAIKTTKTYSQEYQQTKKFIKLNRKLRGHNNAVDVHATLLSIIIKMCFGTCYGIALLYGSNLILQNQITVGEFVAFNSYIGLFFGPVSWLPSLISRWKRAQIAYGRLDKVFQMEQEKIHTSLKVESTKPVEEIEGNVEIRDLTFRYPEFLIPALEHVNITIKKGETLGIIGAIGGGKTTLVNLLTRLYEVERGKILIDGKDINDVPIEQLRETICYITQDNFLFSAKLKDNISMFKEGYENEEIEISTKKAVIYDEINAMPDKIHTVIGERGMDLSGGQKQRVAISRAFLKQSKIVILDDAFCALDNKTEEELLKNIRELTQDKTCIIISNRISDIKHSDNIIVLEEGEIMEQGKHEELIKKHSRYYNYYKQQALNTKESILN